MSLAVDSLAQFCGLSLPTFTQRGWPVPSSLHVTPSLASIASTCLTSRPHKRVDFLTGNCGLCPPTLFRRIGIMAANGDHHPLLANVQTTPTRIASGPGQRTGSRMPMAIGKPSSGPTRPAKTPPASIASGPAQAPLQARGLDNRRRMRVAKPSSRTNDGASVSLSGRPPPWSPSACRRHAPARASPTVRVVSGRPLALPALAEGHDNANQLTSLPEIVACASRCSSRRPARFHACEDDTDPHRIRTCRKARQLDRDAGRQAVQQVRHTPLLPERIGERASRSCRLTRGRQSTATEWRNE
jgi:hypothetical protein